MERWLKDFVKLIMCGLSTAAVFYPLGAGIAWNLDPGQWATWLRCIIVAIWFCMTIGVYDSYSKRK